MRKRRRRSRGGRWLLYLILAAVGLFVAWKMTGPLYPAGHPRREVEIVRDELGVPHVFASGRHDLFFGQGYATAHDRIFQMDLSRRRLLGRQAEILGREFAVRDFQSRALSIERAARNLYRQLNDAEREAVDAYSRGVNEWLRTHDLPGEFERIGYRPEPWRPVDCLVVWRGMALTLTDLMDDFSSEAHGSSEAHSPGPAGDPAGPGGREEAPGSNGWAVSGKLSVTGHPLLAGDPHLGHAMPGPLCRVALNDSAAHATGFAIPGVPGIAAGRTESLAFTPTAFQGDASDVFWFQMDPEKPDRYRDREGWSRVGKRRPLVWVKIKGPIAVPVFWQSIDATSRGPVVRRAGGRLYSLSWPGSDALPGEGLLTVHIPYTRGLRDLETALARLGLPDINVICADQEGNVAHYVAGRIPRRQPHRGPRDGLDSSLAWDGVLPFEAMPRRVNPPEGFVASGNGPPPPGRDYLGYDWPETRQRRLHELLAGRDSLTLAAFAAFQRDHLVTRARQDVSDWLKKLKTDSLNEESRKALLHLEPWDGRAEIDLVAPTLYRTWQAFGTHATGLRRGVDYLARHLGRDMTTWTWGRVHQAMLRHPMDAIDSTWNTGPFPRAGDRGTLDVAGYALFDTTAWPPAVSRHGPALRFLADLSPGGETRGVLLSGQSGDPLSPHYRDQLEMWKAGETSVFAPPGERPGRVMSVEGLAPEGRRGGRE